MRSLRILLALGVAIPLCAQDAQPRKWSLTISPFHLLNPQLHVTGEVRLAPKVSTAAMVGAGRITDEGEEFGIWEAGGQLRAYPFGTFARGLMVGADVGYVDVDGEPQNAMTYLVGTRAGGFLGYKTILRSGFTAEGQLGPVYVWGIGDRTEWQTLVNLKVGWSF